ncbi:MAG: PhoX family phosphatase [Pseudomonadota bacterium]
MESVNTRNVIQDDSSEDLSTNPTNNRTISDVVSAHLSRRTIMQGSLAVAATGFFAPRPGHAGEHASTDAEQNLIDFTPLTTEEVVAGAGRMVTISPDYEYDTLIPWGTPINPALGITPYLGDPNTRPTAAEQEQMVGIGHDGMWFFPINLPRILLLERNMGKKLPAERRRRVLSSRVGVLCVNHEFGRNSHVLGKGFPETLEDVRLSQAAHGVSCVFLRYHKRNNRWLVRPSSKARRITVNTEVTFSGPVAGSALLENAAGNTPRGTVNNCGSGATPWGTYITCEENFNGYFGSTTGEIGGFNALQDAAYERYGFSTGGFGYGWHEFDERFDVSNPNYANESNRFGWCVEIDPFDGSAKPVKRTAMGRFKHEAVAIKELDDGRIAAYMGDDQRGDYCYKYESNQPWQDSIAAGLSPLDEGKLYVARFDDGEGSQDGKGRGEWIELTYENPAIAAAGLTSRDLVLTYARLAADAVGATPMDRPEWSTIGTNGEVYWTLTNNDRKDDGAGALSEVNPIFENSDGYIISTTDTSTTAFDWSMFLIARNTRSENPGDDTNDLAYAAYSAPADGGANVFTDPDAAWADPFGRLFIGTDGGQPDGIEDQMVVIDTATGEYRRLLSGVQSDEITGTAVTPDYQTLFTNTQHPGNGDPTRTNFPAPFDGVTIPRDCTLVIRKKGGGIVGS